MAGSEKTAVRNGKFEVLWPPLDAGKGVSP